MDYKDINSELCMLCGLCCRIHVPVATDERTFEFYEVAGLPIANNEEYPQFGPPKILDMGYCRHMEIVDERIYKCTIYDDRPQMCRDFNCLAWASCVNTIDVSPGVARAREVFEQLRKAKEEV